MDTTAAAVQAGVVTDTIRTWCRRNAIAAVKRSGRWTIDAASLAHRITIGKMKERRMTEQPKYRLEEGTEVQYGTECTVWTVVRTDGTPAGWGPGQDKRIHNATYFTREMADTYRAFYERTPDGYRLERKTHPARSIYSGSYWLVTGSTQDDPSECRYTRDEGEEVKGSHPEGTTWLDVLVSQVQRHAKGASKRIAEKAERDIIEAAEAAVREAREQQLAAARKEKGELATPRQIDYILQLLALRERTGEGGGFFYGPTDRAGIELLSKAEASTYITSLKGDY